MVWVNENVSIDPTVETGVLRLVVVNVPLASAKRPVPPVIVLNVVTGADPVDVSVPVPEVVVKLVAVGGHVSRRTREAW